MSHATIRQWLEEAKFDFTQGRIIYHPVDPDTSNPGWSFLEGTPILMPDNVLDQEFYSSYGGPGSPRFIAEDPVAIYFPWRYDSATGLEKVYKNLDVYLTGDEETPYPGN